MTTNARQTSPLLLVARPATGGLRSHLLSLLTRLDRTKWDISLAAPQSLLETLPETAPPYHAIPLDLAGRLSPGDFRVAGELSAEIIRIQQNRHATPLVHAHGIRAGWICALARRHLAFPLAVTLHNIPPAGLPSSLALRFIARHAGRTLCVSQAIADRVPGKRKQIIPNGIDLARYINLDKSAARRQFGIADTAFMVAAAARLAPEKGIDILLKAAQDLREMAFLIAGTGPQEETLKKEAPANVRFLGRIEDTPALFAACDIAVVPSRSEGQGIVALEAMATGAPVVASNVGGLPEMIQHNGNGLIVPPDDPGALRKALETLQADPSLRSRLGRAARTYAEKDGDITDMIGAIEEVYEALIREKG